MTDPVTTDPPPTEVTTAPTDPTMTTDAAPTTEADEPPTTDAASGIECAEGNHGMTVSSVAHETPPGPGHGKAVSEAAWSTCGKGDDDEADEASDTPGGGNGRGNGRGNGTGHGRSDGRGGHGNG
jgi:hypothetical protein